jgi:hypothetical protein
MAVLQHALIVAVGALSGCKGEEANRMNALEQRLTKNDELLSTQAAAVEDLENEVFFLKVSARPYKQATFDPAADEGFSRLETNVGTLLVSLEQVEQRADGVRIPLHVGNLTSAAITGGTITAVGGQRFAVNTDDRAAAHTAWRESLRTVKAPLVRDLRPGVWNEVGVNLPDLPLSEFGHLEVTIATDRVSLQTTE